MDDLLDLSWSEPKASSVSQPVKKTQGPRDAFADLLNTSPKPVDKTKLSLLEQQRLQQQQQNQEKSNTSSPWLIPTQAATPPSTIPLSSTPISSSTYSPTSFSSVPIASVRPTQTNSSLLGSNLSTKTTTTTSSFEDLLNPFGSNIRKNEQGRNTPLNQLRSQTNSTSTSVNSSQWDLDLLDSKISNTQSRASATSTSTPPPQQQHSLDPFDMESLVKEKKSSPSPVLSIEEEDDNPLGILAGPARPQKTTNKSPSPTMTHHTTTQSTLTEEDEDAMIVQLIDMGFSLQESKFAIEATGGNDLQAAVDLLVQNSETVQRRQPSLNPSRQQSKELSQTERASAALFSNDAPRSPRSRQQKPDSTAQQDGIQQQTEKIVNQAQEFGGFLYKNASSFLKTGREKVTKAVGDWQEQQRTTRINQMKEEQSGSVRPKWMVDGDDTIDISGGSKATEKFADDDDSDNENDMEAERKKIQEMRRIQELKQREAAEIAHKARQQKNSRKEALLFEEEVYVSPSRRRGNTPSSSGRSTPRSSSSNIEKQPQRQEPVQRKSTNPPSPQPPREVRRTRPIISVPTDVMSKVNEARTQGNEKFKLGQFGEAEEFYTRAIDILPSGHDHHVLLSNNRATTRLKIGSYKKCVEDCDVAISLARETGEASSVSEGVTIQWRDQMIKSLYRKAEALENIEKYKEALATYDELVKLEGVGNTKVNQGMSRCRQALNPKKPTVSKKADSPQIRQEKKEDFMSMFDPSVKSPSPASTTVVNQEELSKSKAVAAMRASAAKQEAEDAEKLEKTDDVNARLDAWKVGKEQNLRALLATLDTLLWPGAQWKGAQMSELINPKKCKITYMKAISKVHPDKLPSDVSVEQRMLASGIFASLNEAWDSFKGQNQM